MPIHMADKPTFFMDKIWQSLLRDDIEMNADEFTSKFKEVLPMIGATKIGDFHQKKHTIRRDSKNLWKAGNNIHFVINNRTPQRFQFAPLVKCVSVQRISIHHHIKETPTVIVAGRILTEKDIEQLAINDGFDSVEDFFAWFREDFTGKIIHWTDLKY